MKKLLFILALLFFCEKVSATCNDDMDRKWFWSNSSSQNYDYYLKKRKWNKVNKQDAKYIIWEFKNKTKNKITIKRIGLYAKGNSTKMKTNNVDKYLKPFGITYATMYVGDLNLDVSGSGFSACTYGEPKKTKIETKKPSKNQNYYYKKPKSKRSGDNFTLFNLFLLSLVGLLIFIFVVATKKSEYKKYVKKFPRVIEFADQTIICFQKYSTFKGRASRKEYWYFILFTSIVSLLTFFIDISIFRKNPDGILFINAFFSMVTFLPSIAAGCRRLHDTNRSGWWQLLYLTGIGGIVLLVWKASKTIKSNNNY